MFLLFHNILLQQKDYLLHIFRMLPPYLTSDGEGVSSSTHKLAPNNTELEIQATAGKKFKFQLVASQVAIKLKTCFFF